MKAVVVREIGAGFETAELEIASPLGREVLLDVKASGLCHTDLTMSRYEMGNPLPAVFGHEVAGVVTAVGPDVTELAVGDHVVGCLVQYCGACEKCLSGRVYQCLHPEKTLRTEGEPARLTENGAPVFQAFGLAGFAQQALIHENQLVKVPDEIPFAQAALLGCGVVTGAGAVINTADVQAGDSVVVIGAGGVGLNAINGALVAGAATIIAVDIADDKLEKARSFGATHVVNSSSGDPVAAVLEITGRGADAVFDFVGIKQVAEQGLQMVAPGGGLYLIGVIDPTSEIAVHQVGLIGSQRRIQGVYMGSTTAKRDIPLYAKLYLEGRFELDALLSKEIALDEIEQGYEALKDPNITRVVVTAL
ncbi:S-(hydroxymethyl)glutathione dehydrogenase / alcohol dehydrogenase [Leifsonia sp. 98AMF]|uniref:zinc-binding dehydrogenase n=1 Tax=unclassified Leifsonia TaxID=2663824 RepID=UPI00087ACDF1|nr:MULTISPECIES: zinc-binding dehydrogenase [unclassified Leifsonia]SDH48974.1 S-(hydroxymethyl)glutathione dehydrogenase / alcohol dehydrogenase [Leifsonia sp. 197AMF]SDI88821.1 S-(hydroxymethyl)glutathione dehydrogenase / alcohol dehydrogenase [Leifsonia sp. 466MF]SDJ92076.1 S-(hydroxymethyl)glutathione dehydrogenase / alcohol dehydrogenase [Leifsonia sp. 157MF]SDN92436.1 S-(hydroxymethyl)glutathione dehydrogenase / alcohol dehydrogenase [Leifsonia sp. 509MF]SEN13424.1 S-(hydroxymethyl)gluta